MSVEIQAVDARANLLSEVLTLGKRYSATLGFLPKGAYEDHAAKGHILCAVAAGAVVAYVLFRRTADRIAIAHLCVHEGYRGRGIAKQFIDELVRRFGDDFSELRARCRRDFDANKMWPKLGFVALAERPGRKADSTLTDWVLDLGRPNLFRRPQVVPRPLLRTCIDANVFLDLSSDREQGEESRALLADWLSSEICLHVTQEIFNEIDRHPEEKGRRARRAEASRFALVTSTPKAFDDACAALRNVFTPGESERDQSDFRQIARAIAGGAQFFVTRDERIIDAAEAIDERFGLPVLRPTELIVRIDELRHELEYRPARITGTKLELLRVRPTDVDELVTTFVGAGEEPAVFRNRLNAAVAAPHMFRPEILRVGDGQPAVLVVQDLREPTELRVQFLRAVETPMGPTYVRAIIHQLDQRLDRDRRMIVCNDPEASATAVEALFDLGFCEIDGEWMRLRVPFVGSSGAFRIRVQETAPARVAHRLSSRCVPEQGILTPLDVAALERSFSPAKVVEGCLPCYVIPIRPAWAELLFDSRLGAESLFGSRTDLVFNRESVYYRAAKPGILRAPGRVLWYVSQDQKRPGTGAIRACSRIDEVIVDKPKALFKKFRRFGVYEWRDLYAVAKEDITRDVMAVRFSGTELLDHPISFDAAREHLLNTAEVETTFQSPVDIPESAFVTLYQMARS